MAIAAGLLLLVALAVGLRLIPTVFVPTENWPDEIFQSLEQAHRLIYGYGLIPWEFQLGMRSWLLPGIATALMALARLLGDGPAFYLPVIAGGFALLASAPVICCFFWCRRLFGSVAAFVAAAAVAVAPELVALGARALLEVVAAHVLVLACYVIEPGYAVQSRRRLFLGGFLLGLVCYLRVLLSPAVAIIALWSLRTDPRRRAPALLAGGLAALLGAALFDWLTLGFPLASIWRNLLWNGYFDVASGFGVARWYAYFVYEWGMWSGAALFLLVVVALGARQWPIMLVAALAIIALHSAIPHKEYRFIYPAILLLMVLAAIGLAQLTDWGAGLLARHGMGKGVATALVAMVLLVYWSMLSVRVWFGPTITEIHQYDHNNLSATSFVRTLPAACGVAIYGAEWPQWGRFGGYTYLHRPIPMFWLKDKAELRASSSAFDTLIFRTKPPLDLGYETVRCFGGACVAQRPGSCEARPMPEMYFPDSLAGMRPPRGQFEALPRR